MINDATKLNVEEGSADVSVSLFSLRHACNVDLGLVDNFLDKRISIN